MKENHGSKLIYFILAILFLMGWILSPSGSEKNTKIAQKILKDREKRPKPRTHIVKRKRPNLKIAAKEKVPRDIQIMKQLIAKRKERDKKIAEIAKKNNQELKDKEKKKKKKKKKKKAKKKKKKKKKEGENEEEIFVDDEKDSNFRDDNSYANEPLPAGMFFINDPQSLEQWELYLLNDFSSEKYEFFLTEHRAGRLSDDWFLHLCDLLLQSGDRNMILAGIQALAEKQSIEFFRPLADVVHGPYSLAEKELAMDILDENYTSISQISILELAIQNQITNTQLEAARLVRLSAQSNLIVGNARDRQSNGKNVVSFIDLKDLIEIELAKNPISLVRREFQLTQNYLQSRFQSVASL